MVGKLSARDPQGRQDAGKGDRGRALDVVVEHADPVAIAAQQPEGGMVGEVLELDDDSWEDLHSRTDELFHEFVISRAAQPLLAQADVIGILQKLLVVGAHIEHHRQAQLRMYSGAGGIERELADWDAHPVRAKIAEAEDAFAVRNHDELRRVRPVAKDLGDAAAVVRADEESAGTLKDVPEALAREPHRRRIYQGLNLFDIIANDPEEERLVAVVQGIQRDILLQ